MLKILVLLICVNEAFALDKACPFKPTDLIFVLDGSGSEGQGNFKKQLEFVSNFTNQFEIGRNKTRVALVTFATDVTNEFYLDRYSDNSSVIRAIERAHYPNGETNTHSALDHVRLNSLSPYHGAERNVSRVVFVLTDGHSLEPDATRRASMELKKDPQVTVVAIGIGSGVDDNELRAIASDANHTFQVTNFDALNSIKAELTKTTCDTCNDLSDVCFVLDSSGSEGSANFHQQLEFVKMVVNEFSIDDTSNARICVVTFSTTSQIEIQLNSHNNKTALLDNILKIPYRDGETMTNLGIDESLAQLTGNYANAGARNGANKVMILLTDGRSTEPLLTRNAANKAHRAGIDVFAIGIGSSVDKYELRSIATDLHHVFEVDRFHDLPSIHQDVVDQICAKRSIPTTTIVPSTTTKDMCAAHLLCQNGGQCQRHHGTNTCLCPAGFNGTLCENNVCSHNPCGPNGTCQPTQTEYRYHCTCESGFFGTSPPDHYNVMLSCQYYACDLDSCAPHGRCLPSKFYPYYYCYCDPGYYGATAQLNHHMHDCKHDACMYKRCQNRGECIRTSYFPFYRCHCTAGFTGSDCQEQIYTTHTTREHTTHTTHAQGHITALSMTQTTAQHSTVSNETMKTTAATKITTQATEATTAATTQAHITQTTHAHSHTTALPVTHTTGQHATSSHLTTKTTATTAGTPALTQATALPTAATAATAATTQVTVAATTVPTASTTQVTGAATTVSTAAATTVATAATTQVTEASTTAATATAATATTHVTDAATTVSTAAATTVATASTTQVTGASTTAATAATSTTHVTEAATTAPTAGISATTAAQINTGTPLNPINETFHYCLACKEAVSPHTCDHVTECGNHEKCYVDGYVTPTGLIRYNLGCRDKTDCVSADVPISDWSSSPDVPADEASDYHDIGMPIICSVCCTGSLCNSGGCGHAQFDNLTSGSRGPLCFDCYQQLTTDDCDKIRMCGRDEVCDLRETTVGTTSDVLWQTSCVSRRTCLSLRNSTINGKRRQSVNLCCESDLCNFVDV